MARKRDNREAVAGSVVVPRATYRLQLHRAFGFDAARAVLPYLQRLGISHVYCSPIMRAQAGSQHGYDVVDHTLISPELGGQEAFDRFADAAAALDMGLLLDQVPNHMGVNGADNAWWQDVLENGESSAFAHYFDIDWRPPNPALRGKLLVPVLGAAYGDVLDSGELQLVFDVAMAQLCLRYHEHRFPLDPSTYPVVLHASAGHARLEPAIAAVLRQLAEDFSMLPARTAEAGLHAQRRQSAKALQTRLGGLVASGPAAAGAIAAAVDAVNAEPDKQALHGLHDAQAFRLAHWRLAGDEINYRRFFDVNALAALRVEDEQVFDAVQGTALDLAAAGRVDGLRIDHPDGLLDPAAYFERLQQGFRRRVQALGKNMGDADRGLYVVAEKIVAVHEEVPRTWALQGTTGYRFAMLVNGLFVERRHAQRMDRIWRDTTGVVADYEETVHECKRTVARGALAAQLTVLAHRLQAIALADRHTRDFGFNTLRDALAEVAAAMPVYRTYVVDTVSVQDRRYIDWAVSHARRRSDVDDDAALFEFVRRCMLSEPGADVSADAREQVRDFAMRFQQFCAPVAAKGVEDTAFYRYHRLVSLNEVGGDPGLFGIAAAAFHASNADRAAHWPSTILATSTHDNKRAEDVRTRINVLSEQPAAWRLALRRWKILTRGWRAEVGGAVAPSAADQYLLHQTLLGTLPAGGLVAEELANYRDRIEAYMLKAVREAKLQTSWARPNLAYEGALAAFIRGVLHRVDANPVVADLQTRVAALAWYGALHSVAVAVLKFTSPGVPDLYQGTELIDLSLVDPDNRRPVDFALRGRMLSELEQLPAAADGMAALSDMAKSPTDGRLKLWVIWRLLAMRARRPDLFAAGDYVPLRIRGSHRRHVIAFARRMQGSCVLVIVGRKFAGLESTVGEVPIGAVAWADTAIQRPSWLPAAATGTDVLTGRALQLDQHLMLMRELFAVLPFAAILIET